MSKDDIILYRGYEIDKFYCKDTVSNFTIAQYYRQEKARIDRIIEQESEQKEMTRPVDECIDELMNEWGY